MNIRPHCYNYENDMDNLSESNVKKVFPIMSDILTSNNSFTIGWSSYLEIIKKKKIELLSCFSKG